MKYKPLTNNSIKITRLYRSVANGIQYVKEDKRTKYVLWSVVIILILWLAFDIGILPAIECLFGWALMWLIYSATRNLIRPNKVETQQGLAEAFNINFESLLSDSERYNLLWLAKAIALPIFYNAEHYYYDAQRKEFFYTITSTENAFLIGVLDKFDLEYSEATASDIAVRLELINDESSEIIEIPRLNAQEKVGIQLEFLSYSTSSLVDNELLSVVEDQQDDHGFALDTVLKLRPNTLALLPVWEDFKLKVAFTFISKFTQSVGVEINLLA